MKATVSKKSGLAVIRKILSSCRAHDTHFNSYESFALSDYCFERRSSAKKKSSSSVYIFFRPKVEHIRQAKLFILQQLPRTTLIAAFKFQNFTTVRKTFRQIITKRNQTHQKRQYEASRGLFLAWLLAFVKSFSWLTSATDKR